MNASKNRKRPNRKARRADIWWIPTGAPGQYGCVTYDGPLFANHVVVDEGEPCETYA